MRICGGKTLLLALVFAAVCAAATSSASSGPTASPTSVSFAYIVGNSLAVPAGKVTVTLPAASSTLPLNVVTASSPAWLAVTPDLGYSPLTLAVTVNPTSLAPGSYFGTITVDSDPASGSPAVVAVTLTVSNPPSKLAISSPSSNYTAASGATPAALAFSYTTGDTATTPGSAEIDVSSSGDIIPFTVTTSSSASTSGSSKGKTSTSGGWLRVNGSGQLAAVQTSGAALSGSQVPITVTLDPATVATLDPNSYSGTITIAANNANNGSVTVAITLVVAAGPPTLRSTFPIFPDSIPAGPTVDPVITIYGDNFFSSSVVTLQLNGNPPVQLPSQLLSRKVLQATIKAAYLAASAATVYPVVWVLSVINPAPPTNPSQAPVSTGFTVTDPTQPSITSVVNAASYLPTAVQTGTGTNPVTSGAVSVSPREIIAIFGTNLGPATASTAAPTGTPSAYPTTLGNVQVSFQFGSTTVSAPILMTSSNQVNCIVPVEVAAATGTANGLTVQIVNGAASTTAFPLTVVDEDPGVFSFDGGGQGQAAVLNFDTTSGSYSVNGSKTPATRGSTISIYATGLGDLTSSGGLTNGEVASSAVTLADATARVDIDGQPAVVSYAGTSPGAVAGLVQINAVVPPSVKTGQAIPITVSVGSVTTARRSQPGLTLAVK